MTTTNEACVSGDVLFGFCPHRRSWFGLFVASRRVERRGDVTSGMGLARASVRTETSPHLAAAGKLRCLFFFVFFFFCRVP